MTRRFAVVVAGSASAAAIFVVATALAAYSSPRLEVTQVGNKVTLDVAQSVGDDPTAIARIISPIGTEIADALPPGATVGAATALFVATSDGGAQITTEGRLQVVTSGPATPSGCAAGERVEGSGA